MKNKTLKVMLATTVIGTMLYTTSNVNAESVMVKNNDVKQVTLNEIVEANIAEVKQQEFNREKQRLENLEKIEQINQDNVRKENVGYDADNVSIVSNITAGELEKVLQGFRNGSLADLAPALVKAEHDYKVNVFFLTSLIAHESDWGESARAINQNNLGGYEVYTPDAEGANFSSREASVNSIAKLLRNNYLNPNGPNFHGTSIEDVNTDYCLTVDGSATDYHWSEDINNIANSFVNYYHKNVKEIIDPCS